MLKKTICLFTGLLVSSVFAARIHAQNQPVGIFDGNSDVGSVKNKGSVVYNNAAQQYTVTGSGTNIWFTKDEFHFVWKRIKGDFILRTNAAFIGKGTEAHRKFGLMVRKSLNGSSAHVNAVVHGDGLTSLQYRMADGDSTKEKKSALTAADVIQLERRGNSYTMSAARMGDVFGPEEKIDLDLGDEVYVGIFVCAHNPEVSEKVAFNNVRIVTPAPLIWLPTSNTWAVILRYWICKLTIAVLYTSRQNQYRHPIGRWITNRLFITAKVLFTSTTWQQIHQPF